MRQAAWTRRPLTPLIAVLLVLSGNAVARDGRKVPAALIARAADGVRVRVIAELDVATQPEGGLRSLEARRQQRGQIAAAQAGLRGELAGLDARIHRAFRSIPFVALEADAAALEALRRSPRVVAVQEDLVHRPTLGVSVPIVEADATAAAGFGGAGQTVVVLDTGVDAAHPAFAGKIVGEACFASGSPQGTGDCPGGGIEAMGPGSGTYCTYSSDCFHGSHVAGIGVGGGALPGVARDASLIPIQVFSEFTGVRNCGAPGSCALSWTSDQIGALEHVLDPLRLQFAIASVNLSLGGSPETSQETCDLVNAATKAAIDNLRSFGIATVIAAGNGGFINAIDSPGCISSAVSVSAVDDADAIPSFANAASFLSLWAPGVSIEAPLFQTQGTTIASGTSMATPHVAGAFAILRQAEPAADVDQILGALQATGVFIPDFEAATTRIRIQQALLALTPDCRDGVDNDGDGRVDAASDPGCSDSDDPTETDPALECDDGADNDGDGLADFPADPGCRNLKATEDPACDDGADNDGDGFVDWDGGGVGASDPDCVQAWRGTERPSSGGGGCGLGFELAPVAALLALRRRRGTPV